MYLESMQSFSRYCCSSEDVCCMLPGLGTEAAGFPVVTVTMIKIVV